MGMTIKDFTPNDISLVPSTDLVYELIEPLIDKRVYDEGRCGLRKSSNGVLYCHLDNSESFFALDIGVRNKAWIMRRLAKKKVPAVLIRGVIFISGIKGEPNDKKTVADLINDAKSGL